MVSKQAFLDLLNSETWEKAKFSQVNNPLYNNEQLCAFIKLQELGITTSNSIYAAEHDIIYLDVDVNDMLDKCELDDIIYLRRCGIIYVDDSLAMYV